jgi:tetratricopeptide (TPR) repeat protein
MRLFDFFKNKKQENTGIENSKFNSVEFQNQICALALWKLKENDMNPSIAVYEMKKVGLNEEQVHIILEKVKRISGLKFKASSPDDVGIDEDLFNSEAYRTKILDRAQKLYFQNNHRYEVVQHELFKEGLSRKQSQEIVTALEKKNTEMVDDFQEKLDSGIISEIKITPNPEHTKGNTDQDQIDRYIGYGAYQMDRGDLDNALELFDKAIELDENATLAYANKGKLYGLKNDTEQALFFTNKALELEPGHPQILENKLDFVFELFQEGKINEHEFILNIKDVLASDPQNPNALIFIIQFYQKENRIEDAARSVRELFKKYYSEQFTIQLMVDTMYMLPEEEALKQFDIIENESGEEAQYQLRYNKGLYLKGIGKYDEAILLYDQLNAIQPFSWNYYQMAIMKNLQGNTVECLKLLKTTFELEPSLKEDARNFPELQNLFTDPEFIEIIR